MSFSRDMADARAPSAMWFAVDFPERTDGLILISSAVPGPVPAPIPALVAKYDFLYWAAVSWFLNCCWGR